MLQLDPDYSLAWAGLADGRSTAGYYGMAAPHETLPPAKTAATRAIQERDPFLNDVDGDVPSHGVAASGAPRGGPARRRSAPNRHAVERLNEAVPIESQSGSAILAP